MIQKKFVFRAFFVVLFIFSGALVSCEMRGRKVELSSMQQKIASLLRDNERIVYRAKIHLGGEVVHRLKTVGGGRKGFSFGEKTLALIDFDKRWSKYIYSKNTSRYNKLYDVPKGFFEKQASFSYRVQLRTMCNGMENYKSFLLEAFRAKKRLDFSTSMFAVAKERMNRFIVGCMQDFIVSLRKVGVSEKRIVATAGSFLDIVLSKKEILAVRELSSVVAINFEGNYRVSNLIPVTNLCTSNHEHDYYAGKLDEMGYPRLFGNLTGAGVNLALVEWGRPNTASYCSQISATPSYNLFNPSMSYGRDFCEVNPSQDAFYHADMTSGTILSRGSYSSFCHQLKCNRDEDISVQYPSEYASCSFSSNPPAIANPFGFKGLAPGVNLLVANVGTGFQPGNPFSGLDTFGFYWAMNRPNLPAADVFSVSVIMGNGQPFNTFDSKANTVSPALPVMGAGNDPDQIVSNVTMNGLVVGAYTLGATGSMLSQTSHMNPSGCIGNPPISCHSPHGDMHKPDVVASDNFLGESSSLATPVVASLAALLIEKLPVLRYFPYATKAVIMASACRVFGHVGSGLDKATYGAGGINGRYASYIVSDFIANGGASSSINHHSLGWTFVSDTPYDFETDSFGRKVYKWPNRGQPTFEASANSTIRVALAWQHFYQDRNFPTDGMTDFDLVLQKHVPDPTHPDFPNSPMIWQDQSYAGTYDNNVEVIRHNVGSEGGLFRIVIVRYSSQNQSPQHSDSLAWSTLIHATQTAECQ